MNLREARRKLGCNQAELAERMGTTRNTVARWERGEVPMSGPAVKLIELLLKIRRLLEETKEQR